MQAMRARGSGSAMDDLERDLRERAGGGDREAIGRLLERQTSHLRAAVLAVGVAPGDADDLVQEALARALDHWRDLRNEPEPERALAGWLATIARNVAIDWRRKRERERDRTSGRDPETIAARSDGAAGDGALHGEDAALAGLAADAVALLRLRYGEALSGREIAARLRLPYETVKKRLQRARAEALARLKRRGP
jgi:RNA polymerase sigma-70 factor (ECF subfamily)